MHGFLKRENCKCNAKDWYFQTAFLIVIEDFIWTNCFIKNNSIPLSTTHPYLVKRKATKLTFKLVRFCRHSIWKPNRISFSILFFLNGMFKFLFGEVKLLLWDSEVDFSTYRKLWKLLNRKLFLLSSLTFNSISS